MSLHDAFYKHKYSTQENIISVAYLALTIRNFFLPFCSVHVYYQCMGVISIENQEGPPLMLTLIE